MVKRLVNGEIKNLTDFNIGNIRVYTSADGNSKESFNQVTTSQKENVCKNRKSIPVNGMNLF